MPKMTSKSGKGKYLFSSNQKDKGRQIVEERKTESQKSNIGCRRKVRRESEIEREKRDNAVTPGLHLFQVKFLQVSL